MLLPKSYALAHYKDLIKKKKNKNSLFSSARNSFVKLRLENAVPSSDFGHSENDYLALKI